MGISLMGRSDARDRIVSSLARSGTASCAELARRTLLAPSTVSVVIAELISESLVVERDAPAVPAIGSKGGRPPTQLALHRSAGVAVGIDCGKRHIRVAVADLPHRLLAERALEVTPDQPAADAIDRATDLVRDVLAEASAAPGDVVGVGMGLPGPVHAPTGELGDSTILPGWIGVNAAQAMTEALGLRVTVDNDANLGAVSEWMWGAGRGCDDLVYLKLATGIGAGLIMGGRPFVGAGGTAGEIGHTMIDPDGPICRCGNRGCLEMLAGTGAVLDAFRPTRSAELTIRDVIALATDGDRGCRRVISDAGRDIGIAAANLCNLINPHRIVIGGELAAAGALLLDPLRQSLARATIRSAAHDVEVVPGHLCNRAGVLGAVALACRRSGLTSAAAAS